jgi:hypothetical protein
VKAASNDENAVPTPPGDTLSSSAFYRQRAAECREIAKTASDVATRDEWLRLANQWTYLALHSER